MAEKLGDVDYTLTVPDLLAEVAYYSSTSGSMNMEAFIQEHLKEIASSPVSSSDLHYQYYVWSSIPFHWNRVLPESVQLTVCGSQMEWEDRIHSWAGAQTDATHLYELEMLLKSVNTFSTQARRYLEPFCWRKTISGVGTAEAPCPYLPVTNVKTEATISEEWIRQLITGNLDENEIKTGMISFVQSKDGLDYRVTTAKTPFPDVGQFGFDSEEAFLKGMNQLEKSIIQLRDEAGLASTDLFLDTVKKKQNLSAS